MKLSQMLREGTGEEHKKAERSQFIQFMFKGQITRDAYVKQLECLYHLYSALENEMEIHKNTKAVCNFYFPELRRKESLYSDLIFFMGTSYHPGSPLEKTAKYIDHIKHISDREPIKLIPHAYVRYLGDLSGGQILGKIIRKTFSLSENLGDAFFTFPIENVDQFKNIYRARLDELTEDESVKQSLLLEAKLAFQMNGEVFSDLDVYLLSPK